MRHIVGKDAGKRATMVDVEIGRTPTGGRQFPIAFRLEFIHEWDAATGRGCQDQAAARAQPHRQALVAQS
ncbi:hypothetical protein ROP_08620 [Rhodococcus opacus B4]|uniref:Transposase n=1 Tax=Rhodococcus opacus (strain B4) TaxID=632772 RepID=C1AUA1_RHOOB|nr:hypothetical protein ROP_08620 [Rhodococcus opacus B4]